MRILFVDISSYKPKLPNEYKEVLHKRLLVENSIINSKCGFGLKRGRLNYSRGLLSIATLAKSLGHNVEYYIYNGDESKRLIEDSVSLVEIIAFTCVTPTIYIASDICHIVKIIKPDLVTVVGGPHINAVAVETLEHFPQIDVALVGRGEITFPILLDHFAKGKRPSGIIQDDNKQLLTPTVPDYKILSKPLDCFSHNVRTQENCRYKCEYCYDGQNRMHYSLRKYESIIKELIELGSACESNTLIHFSDAVFTIDKERIMKICDQIRKYLRNVYFSIDTRIDELDEELINSLENASVIYYRFGIETIDKTYQKCNDHIKQLDNFSKIIRKISPRAIIHGYWLTGLPGTTPMSIKNNAMAMQELIECNIVDIISNKLLVPYPGTQYYNNPTAYGLFNLNYDWSKYDRFSYPVYDLDVMTSKEIYDAFIAQERKLVETYLTVHDTISIFEESIDYKFNTYFGEA